MATKSSTKSQGKLLSEKELLAMPEKDYMNDAQLAFFRDRLHQLEHEILTNAGATTENLRETQYVPDPADRATIEEEHALELRTRDRERKLLKKVQQAIARIDAGELAMPVDAGLRVEEAYYFSYPVINEPGGALRELEKWLEASTA